MKNKNKFNSTLNGILFCLIALCILHVNDAKSQTLVWQDNFDSATINPNRWTYDVGDGCQIGNCGWGNAELENYTNRNENVRIENGNLVIEARRENYGSSSFTSARIKTEGRVHFKYGTVEARIKIPNLANGFWPAFWTLGTIGPSWPSIGEIDIMEMGSQSARFANLINKQVSAATHWSNNGTQADAVGIINSSVDLNNDYHLYKMVWTAQSINMYLDNVLFFTQNITNPVANNLTEFHNPHYLIFNLAIGGSYTGILNPADITATLPSKMYIDYVRIYQNPGDEINFGLDNSTSGNYGVFAETTPKTDSLTIGTNATLSYWNNITNIAGAVPFEGNNVWAVRANAGNWFGMGLDNKYINLSTHTSGALKFHFKTSYQGQFKIGLKSSDGDSWINFPASSVQYGLIRDGNWHEVSIPLTAFNSPSTGNYIDYGAVKYAFMFVGDAPSTTADFYFDNIYFSKNTITPTLSSFSVPAKVLGESPFVITPPMSNSGGSFFYSSGNTSVATISGNTITIVGSGTALITATQAAFGNYGSATIATNLVVTTPTLSTAAPTPPLRSATDVISLYSNAYTALAGVDLNPGWGQSTINTDIVISGNNTRKLESFNYQGIQLSGSVNVSTMNSLHIDIWTPNCTQFNLYLINTSPSLVEQKVTLTPTYLGWNSYDIALSNFNLINLSNLNQIKFDCLPFGSSIVYFDNLYFWKTSNAPILSNFSIPAKVLGDAPFTITPPTSNSAGSFTYISSNTSVATISGNQITIVGVGSSTITANQAASGIYSGGSTSANFVVSFPVPSVSPTLPPARNSADYLSIFSDNYTNLSGTDFFPNWNQLTTVSNILIGNNNVKKYETFNYQGIQLASVINVNGMEKVHIDIWTPNCTAFDFYLVNTTPVLVEQKVTLTPTLFGWNSFDIALSNFNTVALNNITQFKFVGLPNGASTVYWDNLYFWKTPVITTPTISITQPTCLTPSGSVQVTSSTAGLTFSIDGINYTNTTGTFTGIAPGNYQLTSKNSLGNVSTAVSFTINPLPNLPQPVTTIFGTRNINQCDTLQTYSLTSVSGTTYNWAVTGTGNRILSGQGASAVNMIMKSAGVISVIPINTCASGTATSISILKSIPTTPTVLTSNGTNVCAYTQSAFLTSGIKDTFRTNTISGATGYLFETPGGSLVQQLNDTTITVVFPDTLTVSTSSPKYIKVYSLSSCDTSLAKSIALTRTLVAAPTAVTITPIQTNICGARKYRYTAPLLPAGALGYVWSFTGSLYGGSGSIDSGTVNSRILTVIYTSNAASAAGDSVRLLYTTGCGNSASKSAKLSNTTLSVPAAPTAITITAIQTNVCGARRYRYSAPALPAATTTAGAATGYLWSLIGSIATTGTIDSGSLTSRIFTATFTSNAAAGVGDSVGVLYTSGCGNSLRKTSKLSNAALSAPLAPASVTIQTVSDVCGARVYRYIAPVLPTATATVGAASGYLWTSPTGIVGSTGVLDSGLTSGRIIRYSYSSNAAATTDSIRVRYTSGCGNGAVKAQKLSNLAKVCLLNSQIITARQTVLQTSTGIKIYPNPNEGQFKIRFERPVSKSEKIAISLFDDKGNCIRRINNLIIEGEIEKQIVVDNLSNGLYFINYIIGNQSGVERIIILK